MRAAQPAVEVVLRIVALVAIEDAFVGLLVLVPDLLRRAVDGERGWPALSVCPRGRFRTPGSGTERDGREN
jgi:hypothetical protein